MPIVAAITVLGAPQGLAAQGESRSTIAVKPQFSQAVAFDISRPLRDLAGRRTTSATSQPQTDRGPIPADRGFSGDAAVQSTAGRVGTASIGAPIANFEGLSNANNQAAFGFRVSPPDPNGDVSPTQYVEMVNLVYAVYSKSGSLLAGPADTGTLWSGFAVQDCTDPSGDPVVLYDQLDDRWILTQFTTRGPIYYNCVAVSATGDATGSYYRYAFSAGEFFPDYPKYGVWSNAFLLSSRDFGPTTEYGISVYALEKNKMINGNPNARAVKFFLDSAVVPIYLMGDGLLPADIDGTRRPQDGDPALFVGSMDDGGPYGAPFDALNVYQLAISWSASPTASFALTAQLPVAAFDSIFPCRPPSSRNCIPQPGTANRIDILSYRQRPTFRAAYRNFGTYEALVTNQSVEALPGVAGVRWYELRRAGSTISLYQQGTYAPNDGVNRWMGSIAQDKSGNAALGYSVSNATTVYPGVRYTGRLKADPLGQMTLGEGVIVNGSGSQTVSARWGDYTDMTVDPVDDCTFWYVNEYYQTSSARGWQTRIGSFKLPGC